jgi:hypothetical protein
MAAQLAASQEGFSSVSKYLDKTGTWLQQKNVLDTGDQLGNDSVVVMMCSIGWNGRVYTGNDTTRPFKPIDHIVTTKLSFDNLSPVYTGP